MKTPVTLTLDIGIVEAHRKIGTNISRFCNEALAAALKDQSILEVKREEFKQLETNLKEAQDKARAEEKVKELLHKALHARSRGQEFAAFIDEAEKLSGLSRAELVARMGKS